VAAGYRGVLGGDFALARFTPTGILDTGFGPNHDGTITTAFGGVAGASRPGPPGRRRNPPGGISQGSQAANSPLPLHGRRQLDTTWGPVITPFAGEDAWVPAPSNRQQANGGRGLCLRGCTSDFALVRYNLSNLQFSAPAFRVHENGGSVTITVTRAGGVPGTATVLATTSNITARPASTTSRSLSS